MPIDLQAQKEITPVLYKDHALKILHSMSMEPFGECFPLHWHNRIELLQITEGDLELQLGNEIHKVCKGELAIVNVRQPHRGLSGSQGVRYQVLMFEPEAFQNSTPASQMYIEPLGQNLIFNPVTRHPEIMETVNQIVLLHEDPATNPLQITGLVYYLLGLFCRYCAGVKNTTVKEDKQFTPILEYINQHFTEKISTKTLSRAFGYDEAYFCRRFKQTTGITTMKYIQILRLEHAQTLLKKTNDNIGDIASQCGFSDIYYFTHCFSKHFGVTPNAFRKGREL